MAYNEILSFASFKRRLPINKRRSDPVWCRLVFRPISLPLGWLMYRAGMTGNGVTIISIIMSLLAFSLIVFGQESTLVVAAFVMLLVSIGDCIDGNIARARGESGPGGEWMDALCGYIVYALLPISIGLHLEKVDPDSIFSGMWVLIGALTSISNLFLRLVYQKYVNVMADKEGGIVRGKKGRVFSTVSGEFGLVGWMMPSLLIAIIFRILDYYLIVYFLFYFISAFSVTYLLARRVICEHHSES